MLRKITSVLAAAVSPTRREGLKQKKLSEHLDWRPEAQSKQNRNRKLSKLSR